MEHDGSENQFVQKKIVDQAIELAAASHCDRPLTWDYFIKKIQLSY
jgi:hypothetical protein